MDVGMHSGLCCKISGNQNLLGGNCACPLLWKKTLSYKAVLYINILGKRAGNKGQLVLLLVGCAEMWETHIRHINVANCLASALTYSQAFTFLIKSQLYAANDYFTFALT